MARTPYVDRNGLKKGTWTPEEDMRLAAYISRYGCRNWRRLPEDAGLKRCGKSCRLRWLNYLRPDIKRGGFTKDEEATILALHEKLGNKWSIIATHMSGRTDNEIKNLWNTHLRKLQPPVELQKEATCSNIDAVDDHHSPQQISAGSNASSGTSCVAADQAMSISRSVAPTGNDEVLISDDFWSQPFLPYGEDIDQGTEAYGTSGDECQMEREMLWFYHALMNYSY